MNLKHVGEELSPADEELVDYWGRTMSSYRIIVWHKMFERLMLFVFFTTSAALIEQAQVGSWVDYS